MKKIALTLAATVAALTIASPAQARAYSENDRVRAYLSPLVHCKYKATMRDLYLVNDSNIARTYRVFTNDRRETTWDHRYTVQPHHRVTVTFYLIMRERQWATVTYRTEVIVHRTMDGICR